MKKKKVLTNEEIYKNNKKKSKILKILSPIVTWLFVILAVIFFILTVKNSIGNITEILNLLDKDIYTGEQLQENYAKLVEKWGEWEIIGENNAGLVIRYVNIGNALFSGLMVTYTILTIFSIVLAICIGKILLPQLAKMYVNINEEMVDVATLKTATKVDEVLDTKKSEREWF